MVRNDEKGITLVELLLTITILSIASVLIWSVFHQGTAYSKKAITKNQMQQEANIIISKLTKIHQNYYYKLNNLNDKIIVEYKSSKNSSIIGSETFENDRMLFEVSNLVIKDIYGNTPSSEEGYINPNIYDTYFKLIVKDSNNSNNELSINTFLYRLKGED